MHTVRRTPAARGDLLEIWLYIAQDNLEAADRFLDTINDKCKLLAAQPEMGPNRSDLGTRVRSFAVRDYLIYYRPIRTGIEVLRVIHGSRDIPAVFQRPKPYVCRGSVCLCNCGATGKMIAVPDAKSNLL